MTIKDLENRISAVEQEIAQLKAERLTSAKPHPIHALEKLHGTFEDVPMRHFAKQCDSAQMAGLVLPQTSIYEGEQVIVVFDTDDFRP